MTQTKQYQPNLKTRVMGVINITPDSFSDGDQCLTLEAATNRARLFDQLGVDYIDIGAESTRPGAKTVSLETEWERLSPTLELLQATQLTAKISVDTSKPEIMLRSANLGARMINNVNGCTDHTTLQKLASDYNNVEYLCMHMQGHPSSMQKKPLDGLDAVETVDAFFRTSFSKLREAGFDSDRIWLDPGIGFGKTDHANALLMAQIPRWSNDYQIAVGVSRKSLMGRLLGIENPEMRDDASKMLEFGLIAAGAKLVRSHEIERLCNIVSLFTVE
jgi:dihydropteroate synthase